MTAAWQQEGGGKEDSVEYGQHCWGSRSPRMGLSQELEMHRPFEGLRCT